MTKQSSPEPSNRARFRVGQIVTVNGVKGKVSRPGRMIDAKNLRANPAFDPNYESEQGLYNGPLWHPLDEAATDQEGRWKNAPPPDEEFSGQR